MSARILVFGLDAAEATLLERWSGDETLPALGGLVASGIGVPLDGCLRTLPGSIWPEITTGRRAAALGLYYHPRQIRTGQARPAPVSDDSIDGTEQFWNVAAEAGRRVAMVDIPQAVVVDGPARQLREWEAHDRLWGPRSHPEGWHAEIEAAHGGWYVDECDTHHAGTAAGYRSLLDALVDATRAKADLLSDLVTQDWDLVACGFGAMHCAGHQFWHLHDPTSPWADEAASRDVGDALRATYRAVDDAVGRIVAAAAPDVVLVVASHGMGPNLGGPQLLHEFLRRIDLSSGASPVAGVPARLPRPLRAIARGVVPARARARVREAAGHMEYPLESARCRAVAVRNNRIGAIRLNLAGREPNGGVAAADRRVTLDRIAAALLRLTQVGSGESVVVAATPIEDAVGADHHPDVPDLIVEFRTDLGPIESVESPEIGVLVAPAKWPDLPRTGDHTDRSKLWLVGTVPGRPTGHTTDVAPTVLDLLGVDPRPFVDGRSLLDR